MPLAQAAPPANTKPSAEEAIKSNAIGVSKNERVKQLAVKTDQETLRHLLTTVGWQSPRFTQPLKRTTIKKKKGKKNGKKKNGKKAEEEQAEKQAEEKRALLINLQAIWSNLIKGLDRWYEADKEHFEKRVSAFLPLSFLSQQADEKYRKLCQWAQCDFCKKWRRLPLNLTDLVNSTEARRFICSDVDTEATCADPQDEMDEDETWDGICH